MKNKSTQTRWYTRNFLQYWGVPDWIQNFLHELLEGDQSRMPTGGMVRFRWDIKQVRVGRGKQEKECDRADVTENSLREIQSQGGRRKTEQDTRGCMRGPGRAGGRSQASMLSKCAPWITSGLPRRKESTSSEWARTTDALHLCSPRPANI